MRKRIGTENISDIYVVSKKDFILLSIINIYSATRGHLKLT
jgi:hypothetical protein